MLPFSALSQCWLGYAACKFIKLTYCVSGGTLNITRSLTAGPYTWGQSLTWYARLPTNFCQYQIILLGDMFHIV